MSSIPHLRWKRSFIILLVISLGIIVWLAYAILDQAVTISYMQVGYGDTKKALSVLAGVTPEFSRGMKKNDVLFILRKHNPDAFIAEDSNALYIEQLKFSFNEKNELVEIVFR